MKAQCQSALQEQAAKTKAGNRCVSRIKGSVPRSRTSRALPQQVDGVKARRCSGGFERQLHRNRGRAARSRHKVPADLVKRSLIRPDSKWAACLTELLGCLQRARQGAGRAQPRREKSRGSRWDHRRGAGPAGTALRAPGQPRLSCSCRRLPATAAADSPARAQNNLLTDLEDQVDGTGNRLAAAQVRPLLLLG